MKKLVLLIGAMVLLTACSASPSATKISASKAMDMINSQDVIIVDVRTQQEYDEGHIEHAILIVNETIVNEPAELPDKNATILIYCRSGNRSAQAAAKLVKLGYTHIYDFGGIIDWPYAIVK
jgi:phage shock protein E